MRLFLRAIVVALFWLGYATLARADAVDDAFASGNAAAQEQDWEAAAVAYEQAAALLPTRSAHVSYNLGTVYANLGDNGRATYHLQRALDFRAGATTEIVEASRYNLSVVRRRVELDATSTGNLVDRPETTWDLVVEALAARGVGIFALLSGWAFLGVLLIRRRLARGTSRLKGVAGAVLIVLGCCFVLPGIFYGWAARAERTSPQAIVLDARVDAREGPGNHRRVAFTLQGGARVRIIDRTPGWQQLRLPGRLEGWVPEDAIGTLDAPKAVASAPQRVRPQSP